MKTTLLALVIISVLITVACKRSDWTNLDYYKGKNAELEPPKPGENRIVFMGNSITQGWDDFHPEFFMNSSYINRGIGGQTTGQMLARFKQDVIDLEPALVVILAGTNDIAENDGPIAIKDIAKNIISMAEMARENNIKVLISAVLPAYDYPWRPGLKPNEKIPELNSLLKEYTTKNNLAYLDYFSAMVNDKNGLIDSLAYDGVHPNKEGYLVMEGLLETTIKEALVK